MLCVGVYIYMEGVDRVVRAGEGDIVSCDIGVCI